MILMNKSKLEIGSNNEGVGVSLVYYVCAYVYIDLCISTLRCSQLSKQIFAMKPHYKRNSMLFFRYALIIKNTVIFQKGECSMPLASKTLPPAPHQCPSGYIFAGVYCPHQPYNQLIHHIGKCHCF